MKNQENHAEKERKIRKPARNGGDGNAQTDKQSDTQTLQVRDSTDQEAVHWKENKPYQV